MTTNPYESPEQSTNRQRQSSFWPKPFFEFLALLCLLGFLGLLAMPRHFLSFGSREAARRVSCSNNLHNIALALRAYESDYHSLPPAYTADDDGKPLHSWRTLLLPYLEQKQLFRQIDLSKPWDDPANKEAYDTPLKIYQCPSTTIDRTMTTYLAVVGTGTAWPGARAIKLADITDGTSNAILVAESNTSGVHWMEPRDLNFDGIPMAINPPSGAGISSSHPSVAQALFADGHIAVLTKNTPPEIIRRLLTIADGEQIGDY